MIQVTKILCPRSLLAAVMLAGALMPRSIHAGALPPPCPMTLSIAEATRLQMEVLNSLFKLDEASFDRLTTPDFVIFDIGRIVSRDELFQTMRKMKSTGGYARWSITQPRVQADCKLALLTYRNVGEVKIGSDSPVPMQWLESATFRKQRNKWQLSFMSSMREAAFASNAAVQDRGQVAQ